MQKNFLQSSKGMTAIELVIVIGIFSIISSVTFLNYGQFQSKVSVKNLANDIALKVVEAQKSAVAGIGTSGAGSSWKPAYGVHFNINSSTQFVYFADLDNSGTCNSAGCSTPFSVDGGTGGEVLSISSMIGGTSLQTSPSGLEVSGTDCPSTVNSVTIVYRRPNTSPIFSSSPALGCTPFYVGINITSPKSIAGRVRIYSSGRIVMN